MKRIPPTIKEKILLHLYEYKNYRHEMIVPYELCIPGISKILNLKQNVIRMEISQMKKRGENLIEEDIKHVRGVAKKRKVYFLTSKGYERAREIRERIMNMNTKVVLDNGRIIDIKLKEIGKHIHYKNPLIVAINNMDENGIIHLNIRKEKKKDIFVGREKEINYLWSVIEKLKNGGKIIFVTGEAGIGKTRLILEMRKEIMKRGYEFFWGRAYFDSSEPYLPFKEIFENYLNTGKDDNIKLLINVVKSLFYRESGMNVEDKKSFESQRNSMWWEISERIKDVASIRPLIIFIDDLQWADRSTLQLLLYLGDHLRDSPVLLIGAIREGENNEYLEDVLERMSRMNLYEELKLKGLKWKDTKEIIENIVGKENVPEEFINLIYRNTKGNPLFIRELVREMIDEGIIDPIKGKYPTKDELKIPRIIDQLVKRRIKLLNNKERKILEIGSVIGENIPYPLLLSISQIEEFELLDYVDNLISIGLWYEELNEEKLSFSHGLIQLAVYENIPKIKRKKLHLMIAEKMKKIYKENLNNYYSELAYHYERGGDNKNAVEYYVKAGEEAEKIYAHEDAISFYEKALELIHDYVKKSNIYTKLGDIYGVMGEYDKAESYYHKALKIIKENERKAKITMKIGDLHARRGNYKEAMKNYDNALRYLSEKSEIYASVYNSISWVYFELGKYYKAIEYANMAIEKSLNDKDKARGYHNIGTVYLNMGNYKLALQFLNKAVKIHKKLKNLKRLSVDYNNIGIVLQKMGNIDEALRYYEYSLKALEKVGDKDGLSAVYGNIGTLYFYKGEIDKALQYYEKSLYMNEKIGCKQGIGAILVNLGYGSMKKGDLKKATEFFENSLKIIEDIGDAYTISFAYKGLAELYLELKNIKLSIEYIKKSMEIANKIGSQYLLCEGYILLSYINVFQDNFKKGIEYGGIALSLAKEIESNIEIMKSYRVLGVAYREKGDYEKGEDYLKKAMNISEELGMKGEYAINLYELGLLYKKQEDEKWKETIEKARSIFKAK